MQGLSDGASPAPKRVLFDFSLPPGVLVSYLRLLALAQENGRCQCGPFSMEAELIPHLGLKRSQVFLHLRQLRLVNLLSWRIVGAGYTFYFTGLAERESGKPDSPESGRPDEPESGRPDEPESGRSHEPESGRSDGLESGRPDEPESGRSDSQESERPDERKSGRPDSQESGRPDEPESERPDERKSGGSDEPESGRPGSLESGRSDSRESVNSDTAVVDVVQLRFEEEELIQHQQQYPLLAEKSENRPPAAGLGLPGSHALYAGQVELQTLSEEPAYRETMGWLLRAGVWTDRAIQIALQICANERLDKYFLPARADVLGWIAYCNAYQRENKIDKPASVIAANLLNYRRCPEKLRPPRVCLACHLVEGRCRCGGEPDYGFPAEFIERAFHIDYDPYSDSLWGICSFCGGFPCQCPEEDEERSDEAVSAPE